MAVEIAIRFLAVAGLMALIVFTVGPLLVRWGRR